MNDTVYLTVKLSPDLRKKAQAVASLRGETVSDVVRAALKEYIRDALQDARDNRDLDALESAIDTGKAPLRDHADVWAEIERLEALGELPA